MKKYIPLICFLAMAYPAISQNLVPNGGFECYSTCPDQYDQVSYAKSWDSPVLHNGSWPDYHNKCDINNGMGFPLNGNPGDSARTGNGCMGFMFWQNYDPNAREYIQAKLLQPLQNGKCYELTFYVKLYIGLNMGIDRIGAHFSTNAISSASQNLYGYIPQVQNTPGVPISSTTTWTQISGTFVAAGGEDYITIGNFFNDAATTTDGNPTGWYSHYYIDDICLVECGNSCAPTIAGLASVCSGSAATLSATPGGTSYSWSNGATANSITVNPTTTTQYSVIIDDTVACQTHYDTTTVSVFALPTLTLTTTPVLCNGGSTGTAKVAATSTGPYTYSWSAGGQTTATATGLAAGTYTATVTDGNGCIAQGTVTVTQPALLTTSITAQSNLLCFGNSNAFAKATGFGGSPGYTYSWSNGQTDGTATGLSAAVYTATVTDINGCKATTTVTITQPSVLTASISAKTNISCNGNSNGNATVAAGGGTGAYTYSWNNSQTTATATGLSATTYSVTVTDSNGCTATTTLTITQPAILTSSISAQTNVLCNGNNTGAATVAASGGTTSYSYSWNNSQTNSTAIGLSASTYSVTVTDANGCTSQSTVTITQPPVLTASISAQTNVLCNGNNTGAATVAAGGGSGAYTYSWSNGHTNAAATNLSANTFTVTVTDNNGCTVTTTVTITQPSALSLTLTPTNLLCNGIAAGQVNSNVQGGTPNYTYSWSTAATTGNISSLTIGNYTLTVTDNNGCTIQNSTTITQPAALTLTLSSTPDHCNQGDGTASAAAGGGTGAYTYNWSTAQASASISGLSANTYTATITDNNGCSISQSVLVAAQASDTLQIVNVTDVNCNGVCNGSITLQLSGAANGPYQYSWSNGQTNLTATGLCAGIHTCSVTDGVGCVSTKQITINQPSVLTASISAKTNVLCNGDNTGSATVAVGGGTPNYTYSWNNTQTNAISTGLAAATFSVTVTDSQGCTTQTTVTITEPPVLSVTLTPTNLLCNNISTGQVSSNVQGGTPNYSYSWSTTVTTNNISFLSIGNYSLTVTDNNGCTVQANTTITQPAVLNMTLTSTPDHCNQGDGTATAAVSGGTGAYTYSWSNGQNTSSISNLSANTYTATVTDNNGCTLVQTVAVAQQVSDTLQVVSVNHVSCNGVCDGSATLQLSGMTNPPFSFLWSNGQTNLAATGLCAGVHTCSVTDGVGCLSTKQITINQPAVLTASISAQTDVLCNGNNTGSATVTAGGGTPNYTYNWSNAQTNVTAGNLTAATFSVIVTDNNGCTVQTTATITEPPVLSLTLTPTDLLCNNISTGQVISNIQGGSPNYIYNWSNTATTNNISLLAAGNYSLTVTDANGCTVQSSVTLTGPSLITLTISSTPDHCNLSDGTANVSVSGGTGAYTYSWSGTSQTNNNPVGLAAGTYTVIVTDNNQCTQSTTVNVLPEVSDTLQLVGISNVNCNNACDGTATLQMSGLTHAPYNYSWNTVAPQTTLTATGLCAGIYSCTVTDVNGCKDVMSVTITQPAALSATLSATNTLCFGDSSGTATVANVSGGTPNYNYSWNNNQLTAGANNLSAGTYTVVITDNNGCSIAQTIQVYNAPQLLINIPSPGVICQGQQTTINSNVVGGTPNYNYNWSSGQNTSSINVSPPQTADYTVTVTDNNGCTAQAVTQVTVNALPVVSFTADITEGCEPLCVNFNNTTPNSQSQTWNFGDGSGSVLFAPNHCFTGAGSYSITLVVVDNNLCSDSLTLNNYIRVHPNPIAAFQVNPSPAPVNTIVSFTDQSTGAVAWDWSFGDAISSGSNLQNPTFVYTDSGYYQVRLIVSNQFGCSDTSIQLLFIEPDFIFYIPNTFTPNGDGLNDIFLPALYGIEEDTYEFYVFDRWGNLIFQSNSSISGWDGRANGGSLVAQQDTYVWMLKVKDIRGKKHKYVGHVNLIK